MRYFEILNVSFPLHDLTRELKQVALTSIPVRESPKAHHLTRPNPTRQRRYSRCGSDGN